MTRILAALLLCLWVIASPAQATTVVRTSQTADQEIPQDDISTHPGVPLMPVTFTLSAKTTVLITVSVRWWPKYPATTCGDRVAFVQIDGTNTEPLQIADSSPNNLTQLSTVFFYARQLTSGQHTVRVIFGGCCGIEGHPFYVGAGSEVQVIY